MSDSIPESETVTLADLANAIITGMETEVEVNGKRIDQLPTPAEIYRRFISELQCLHLRLQAAYQQTGDEQIIDRARLIGRLNNYLYLNMPKAWAEESGEDSEEDG